MLLRSDAAEKRQHIVETAYHLFKRDGFHATGIDKIIAEAGVAKMTMYRHFPSKDGLMVEVLDWRAERFDRQLGWVADTDATAQEKIVAIFDWHKRWFDSPDFHGCLFQHALAEFGEPDHAVFDAAMRQKRNLRQRLQSILAEVVSAGRAQQLAMTLFMLLEGATLLAQLGQGEAAIDNARRTAVGLLAAGTRQ